MNLILLYFLVLNSIAFVFTSYDKYLAVNQKRRIPESTLFFLEAGGGTIGLLLAMLFFRHKTSKTSFLVKFCGIFLIQILIAVLLLIYKNDILVLPSF